jgi:hypothetical protein
MSNVKKSDAQSIAILIRDSGAPNRQQLATDIAEHLEFTSGYSSGEFVTDATDRERTPQERFQAEHEDDDSVSHPGSGVV